MKGIVGLERVYRTLSMHGVICTLIVGELPVATFPNGPRRVSGRERLAICQPGRTDVILVDSE